MNYIYKILLYFLTILLSINCFANQSQHNKFSILEKISQLESIYHVRLGIAAINTSTKEAIYYRADEYFPIQSTFKLIGVSAVLHQSMENPNLLNQKIFYNKSDVVTWSPIVEENTHKGMTISELCAAAMMYSDNTAINLLVKKLGGLNSINQFARFIKNDSFKLDHFEPNMNSDPSQLEDTSTPRDMQKSLQQLVFGEIFSPKQRGLLIDWMKGNTTGNTKIRAGVPKEWIVADKTGTGDYGVTNDIGIIWPPNRPPIILAIYSVQYDKSAARRDDIVAEVSRLIIEEFNKHTSNPHAEVLQRADLFDTPYQLGMGVVNFEPNAIKASQVQNGPELLYVLDGEISYIAEGKNPKIITKGESYQIPAGEIHYSQAGPKGAKILASWVLEKHKLKIKDKKNPLQLPTLRCTRRVV